MRIFFLALLTFTALCSAADTMSVAAQDSTVSAPNSEKGQAVAIENLYRDFIDTKPSSKKHALAVQTKEAIETFEATFPDSELTPALLDLLQEIDVYLNP